MKHLKLNNLIQDLQSVQMTQQEKSEVFARSWSAIEKIEALHASTIGTARVVEVGKREVSVSTSLKSAWYSYFMEKKFVPALSLAVLLLATGGTSLAAESALPGQFLYPVKIGLNEQVRGFTAITPEAKAKFALEVTDRRLKEVALLSSKGLLNDETSSIIQDQLIKQAGQIKNQVASLVSTKNIRAAQEISLNFESSLRAHELILEKISGLNSASIDVASVSSSDSSTSTDMDTLALGSNAQNAKAFSSGATLMLSGSDSTHIASLIATIKTQIATTTAARTLLQATEVQDDTQNQEKMFARLAEIKLKAIEIKRIASTTPVSSPARSSTSLSYIGVSDALVITATQKIASSSYTDALLDIQKASQYLIDAETLITAEYDTDPALKKLIDDALSLPNFSQIGSTPTASSTDATVSSSTPSASTTATSTSSGN